MMGALVPSTSTVIGDPLTVITTVALPSRRGKEFVIPELLSLVVSETDVASVVVVVSTAVEAGEELRLTSCAEQPPNIREPIIKNATKNCENFNRIVQLLTQPKYISLL
ncbi:alr4288 [Nostoc sp. PCC 7120 = FACHB-418]|nr:alr4288 [Nostoc sp. PCC 7120 = FACHB-418]